MTSSWQQVPIVFHYLRPSAEKFGLRGLTGYFVPKPLETYVFDSELPELAEAYEAVAARSHSVAISNWCRSVDAGSPAFETKEKIRGLLVMFERLAEYALKPFSDERVRYIYPPKRVFDWSLLPASLQTWQSWLKKFEDLTTEWETYSYVQSATDDQRRELAILKALVDREGEALRTWCEDHSGNDDPAGPEAFQAEWLFLLVDFGDWKRDVDGNLQCPH
jgi:hypothetical protein